MQEIEWLKDVLYLIPIAALIWKAAVLTTEAKQTKADVVKLTDIVNHNKIVSENVMKEVSDKLTEIQLSVAKIETKLEKEDDD